MTDKQLLDWFIIAFIAAAFTLVIILTVSCAPKRLEEEKARRAAFESELAKGRVLECPYCGGVLKLQAEAIERGGRRGD